MLTRVPGTYAQRVGLWMPLAITFLLSLSARSQSNQIEKFQLGQQFLDSAAVKIRHGSAHQSLLYLDSASVNFEAAHSDSGKLAVAIQRIESLNRLGQVLKGETIFQEISSQVRLKPWPRLHALLLLSYGRNLLLQGGFGRCWELLDQVKQVSKNLNDPLVLGWLAYLEGNLYQQVDNRKIARAHYQEAINYTYRSGDLDARGYCWFRMTDLQIGTLKDGLVTNFQDSLNYLALTHDMPQHRLHELELGIKQQLDSDSIDKVNEAFQQARKLARQLGNESMRFRLQMRLLQYKYMLPTKLVGDDQLIAAADTLAAKGYKSMEIHLYQRLHTRYRFAGDTVKEMEYLHKSLDLARAVGDVAAERQAFKLWASREAHRGNGAFAIKLIKQAQDLSRLRSGLGVRLGLQSDLALYNFFSVGTIEAIQVVEQALSQVDEVEVLHYKVDIHLRAGQILRGTDPDRAIFHLKQALKVLEVEPEVNQRRYVYYFLQDIYQKQGDYLKAFNALGQLYQIRTQMFQTQRESHARSQELAYEGEKKKHLLIQAEQEKELQALKLDQQESQLVRNQQYLLLVVLGSLLVLASGLFLFYRYRTSKENERLQLRAQQLELEREREKANQQLQMAEWRSTIFTNVAHELRTPLTLILGPLRQERAKREGVAPTEVEQIHQQAENLLELLNDTLDMARSGEASERFRLERFEVSPFVSEVVQSFAPLSTANRISLHLEDHAAGIYLYFDQLALRKILVNLLGNAFKYGKPDGSIRVGLKETEADQLQLRVQDEGAGILPDHLPQIFDRFYQVDSESTGSGLGLALVRELVERDGGEISVSSEVGTGTTFTVLLPIERPKPVRENLDAGQPLDGHGGTAQKTILVVEDHPDMQQYVSSLLEPNYHVITAADGEEGIALAEAQQPDLIVSDIMMPVKDGLALTSYLKAQWETSHIPIVMLTARAAVEQKLEGLETGADDYLSKPFHPDELKQRIKNLLQQREQLRAVYARDHQLEIQVLATNKRDQDFLENARNIIEQQLDNPEFSVDDFCRELALNRTSVHHKFKALTGGSTGQFIRGFRVRKAAALLLETDLPVGDISAMVGFNSRQAFYNAFREVHETTPTAYRRVSVR